MEDQFDDLLNADRSLFPGSFTIRAIRDSRYHNTAYAIAELIDNSIEADAERVELLCMEQAEVVTSRKSRRVSEIGVLDNGSGMDRMTLLEALKFGGGDRPRSTTGVGRIGKYGMGLPTSSMSQCTKVDVWTWQDGLNSVWHSSLDADKIEGGDHQVPIPDRDIPIPDRWLQAGSDNIFQHRTGTLVVWSNLDKVQWKTGNTIIDHTSREIGRIHRIFIDADMTRIRTATFLVNRPSEPILDTIVVVNDPLYLLSPTSVPDEPWDSVPMFKQWGESRYYPVTVDGKDETIEVKYSIVKPEALKTAIVTQNPGATPRGRHARHNIGVSVIREDREIVLEDAFLREGGSAENPQNRWWGCEVHFRPSCDELFGVDHNKQMVANFTQAAKTLARDDRARQVVLDEMGVEDDDPIYTIVSDIRDQTRAMMENIRQMFAQRRKIDRTKDDKKTPEGKAVKTQTDADRDAIESGIEQKTRTDVDREEIAIDQRVAGLTEQFIASGQSEDEAQELAKMLVEDDLSYLFQPAQLDGYQMFNVRSHQGVLHINLNTDHPIYDLISHVEDRLNTESDESDPAFQAIVALRLLLSSWARMEDQTQSREDRARIQYIAMTWGRQVDKVINQLRERET
ncbi:MAG: hypothetical protein F4Y08_15595 [Caldilineaceae bacterium SB0662_bin_9]|uniref:ATP-binding protein n=1 Tax=Caldilineaceae bacterium SB0662_bin_9 TaxID=2605258 RepID=A0A6B1DWJ9_9CHLR|nr:hypothetical protein [Caldilineaceae bacterium SB0662_bin_9]